jgi:hypothetical protein
VRRSTLCDKVVQWLATGWCFSPGTPVSSTNKTDLHDISEILLKAVLNPSMVIDTDCIGSCRTNYHTITATTPQYLYYAPFNRIEYVDDNNDTLNIWYNLFNEIRVRRSTLCDKVVQWLATGWCFSPGTPVSSTNKTDLHDISEILLKAVLNTIKQTNNRKDDYFCSLLIVLD